MNQKIGFIGIVLLILFSSAVFADSDHGNFSRAIDIIDKKTPYTELSDEDFEVLGDYFMELIHRKNHEFMDRMMGGEGSESLRQMHIEMGKNFYSEYLKSGSIQANGMMGSSMMGSTYNGGGYTMMSGGFGNMMLPGYGHSFFGFGFLAMAAFWGFVIWLIVWLINKDKEPITQRKSPLEIVKRRYAKGEINKKQFEDMKKELRG
ncbi:hypothetical protein GOV08_03290 [Candidatus Woesearchaeota archaeon]|nr:hypothetical protein [Candidatus Woesearchaeota archaeon]